MSSSERIIPATAWPARASERTDDRLAADLSDDELMSLVKTGDHAALAVLMRRHARVVLAVGRRVLRDQGAAEELVQDVFLLIYKRCQLFDPRRGSLRAWVIQIAYNEAYRTRQRLTLRHIYEDHAMDDCLDVIEAAATPEYHALLAQSENLLKQAFKRLSKKQQRTMELFFFEGYTLREISELMGESLGNVRHYYYRALKQLKDMIGADRRLNGES